ncbi:metallo-dependent phosphatase, partial [Pseudomonas aeruginosa]
MKIRLLSDLHHEHFDGRRQLPEVEADVVVLAGDIHSHLEGLHWARETFADSEIVYVAGNHEFYSSEMTDLTQAMRNIARALEIHFLENDEVRIGPARFLGATLWTDFQLYGADGYAPAHELALQSMPDFSCIDWFGGDFTPEQSIALHQASRDWLAEQLARPHDGPTLVVSHHAPSALSIPPQFVGNPLSPAFA